MSLMVSTAAKRRKRGRNRKGLYLFFAFFFLAHLHQNASADPSVASSEPCTWNTITPDLEASETSLSYGLLSSAKIYLYRSTLSRFDFQIIRAQKFGLKTASVKTLCQLARATVCINASFFDEQYKPLGLLIEKGSIIQKIQKGGGVLTGVLQRSRDAVSIIHRDSFSPKNIVEALQAGPRVVSGGIPITGLSEADLSGRRSGVCIDSQKRLLLYGITAPLFGVSMKAVQKRLLEDDIHCVDALNLDGGSSTQLYGQPFEITGEDEVPVALGLFPVA